MRTHQTVITPDELVAKVTPFIGKTFEAVSTETGVKFPERLQGKGVVGHFVEDLVGLPRDNDRLDYAWGDLKTKCRHQNSQLGGCVIGSLNSLAAEMLTEDVNFDEFILGKKIGQTVLVTVCTNRKGGGAAGNGWENFTFEGVASHALRSLPEWEGIKEDWGYLKDYTFKCLLAGEKVSSSKKGPNDFLSFNSCGGSFTFKGVNLRRSGGIQLALGATLMRKVCA